MGNPALSAARHDEGEGKVVPKRERPALKSPLAGRGLGGPKELRLEMLSTSVVGFSHADCTRISKQGGDFAFQVIAGANSETTTQVTARQEFARLPMSRQQRGVIASSTEQSK